MTPGPLRILHVAESAGWAGGETYMIALARALDPGRFALSVVAAEEGPMIGRLQELGVPTFTVPIAARLVTPRGLFGLIDVFRRVRPVLVQSHGARTNVYTKLAGRLVRVPIVVSTVHNSLFDYDITWGRRHAYVLAERLTGPLGDGVVAVSAAIARDLVERYGMPASRVTVIHNGIAANFAPSRARESVQKELGLTEGTPVIGVVARMTPQKGHRFLLAALRRLVVTRPALRLVLVGDGPLRGALEAEAETLGVGGHCLFLGARGDVADLLPAFDIVVLPSVSEGLPFTILEAMALGRPVVATKVGGTAEVVEHECSGLLVPSRDVGALVGALARLLDDPGEAARLGARARDRVREHFTQERMIGSLMALYDRLLKARGSPEGRG